MTITLLDAISEATSQKKKKVTFEQFGTALGVSKQYISQIQNKPLSDEQIKTLEEKLEINLSKLSHGLDTVNLDYFPDVYASCGHGSSVFDESSEKVPVPISYITNYSSHNRYVMITARGNSMTPDIFDMDKVIIKQYTGSQIVDDKMYLFRYMDEIFIKKLCKNLDQVVVKSNNPDFPNRFIEGERLKDMSIIGEVVGLVRAYS